MPTLRLTILKRFIKTVLSCSIFIPGLLVCSSLAQTAFVRVNQVGYASGGPKRAYLISCSSEAGATFRVRSGSTTVLSAAIGASLGYWSRCHPNVYALALDNMTTAGHYS